MKFVIYTNLRVTKKILNEGMCCRFLNQVSGVIYKRRNINLMKSESSVIMQRKRKIEVRL